MPFTLVAGDKDTLTSSGLDCRATRGMADLLATRPIYRPDLNLTKDNMNSQCIFLKPRPDTPGWRTPAAVEQSHQWHRDLTQSEDQVEMQLKPAFQWVNEQQATHDAHRRSQPTNTAPHHQNRRQQGLQRSAVLLQSRNHRILSTVRLQVATEHPVLCQHEQVDLATQLSREIGRPIEDLALEQVSPDRGRSTQLVHTFLVPKDAKYLQTPPYYCTINTSAQGTIKVQLQHCGTRMSLQPPRRAITRMQDTMADMHDTLIGRHQTLPSRSTKGQRLGVADTSTIESIMRTQRVTIVDTYEGPGKTRVLIVQDQIAAVAIDAQVHTSEAHDLYEQLNLTKWYDKHTNQRQLPQVTHLNVTLADYHKHHAPNQSCLLHLRVEGTQPYKLPKLNADIRTGKYDTTPREAIHLLPYQTFDLIIPLPDKALVPHLSTEPLRVTVVGHITPTRTPQQAVNQPATTQEYAHPSPPRSDQTNIPATTQDQPDLPAFPVLQSAPAAPEPQRTPSGRTPQPTPEQLTPTVYFQINEQHEQQPNNSIQPGTKPTSPPQDTTVPAEMTPNQGAATTAIPIGDDEGDRSRGTSRWNQPNGLPTTATATVRKTPPQ